MPSRSPTPASFPESHHLVGRLPQVRGKLLENEPLAPQTWFRVGGPAEVLFRPADQTDLEYFLTNCPADIPLTFLGVASNLLIRDGGIPGVVIRLGPPFSYIKVHGSMIEAGAAALDVNIARAAQMAGIAGLEFLSGIPGTLGGGLRMNAGAYGSEFKDIVEQAELINRFGQKRTLLRGEFGFGYRHSEVPDEDLFLNACLKGEPGEPAAILERMNEIKRSREESQPIRDKTGGSTFANPDDPQKRKAWQLIEAVDGRGLKIGHAKMSEKHCNFLINTGYATAADIENLGEEVRRRVKEKFGLELRWEIKRIGIRPNNERAN